MNIIRVLLNYLSKIRIYRRKRIWKKSGHVKMRDSVMIFNETSITANLGVIEIGDRSCIRGALEIQRKNGNIKIGDFCYIGDHSRIWAADNIEIGNHVLIAHNCNIFDNDTHPLDSAERRIDAENIIWHGIRNNYDSLRHAPIYIGDNAWIGCNSIILKGVTIGGGALLLLAAL